MNTKTLRNMTLLAAAAWALLGGAIGAVADAPPETAPATVPSDKSSYSLIDPTPADQMRDMDTDRPNKTNTPHTIDAGHLQIETGVFDYGYDRDQYQGADTSTDTWELGQFNFRLGVLNNLELNGVLNSYDFQRTVDYAAGKSTRQMGLGDTVIGGKLNLWGNDGSDGTWATALGIQPQFKIPTARENLGNGRPELFVGIPFLTNLPADFHLGLQTTPSWERRTDNQGEVAGWQNAASVDRVFLGKFDTYLEYWSHVSAQRHQESQQTLDVGVTYPLGKNVVLDTGLNLGLNKASETLEWLAGISLRF